MPLLRACSPALATALAAGNIKYQADLYYFAFASGSNRRYTSWERDLKIGDFTYVAYAPWINRSRWNVVNTMQVPEMTIVIKAHNDVPNVKTQAVQGLYDGGTLLLSRLYMPTEGDVTTYGSVDLFYGDIGQVQVTGTEITLRVKGRNNKLDVMAPRNVYKQSCRHTFCDAGCTLSAGSFTASYTVGASPAPTRTFLPWAAAPGSPLVYTLGKVTMLTGLDAGQIRSVITADSTGLTLAYPLLSTPVAGDTFSALQGCDKTVGRDLGTGVAIAPTAGGNCNSYSNILNFGGFPFVPNPELMATGAGF